MTLVLRAQNPVNIGASPYEVAMTGDRLTIGRGMENDLVLPDPDRTLSKRHCIVEHSGAGFTVTDTSTNGTFLNYAQDRLDTVPTPVSHGDVILVGHFEIIVEIGTATDAQPGHARSSEALLPPLEAASPMPLHVPPVGPALQAKTAAEAPGDFIDDLLGTPAPEDLGSHPNHTPAAQDHFDPPRLNTAPIPDDWADSFVHVDDSGAPLASRETEGPTIPPQPMPVISDGAFESFLEGLGPTHLDVPANEIDETMRRMGRVMAAMITGMREVLLARAALKSELRMDRTMINPAGNNPLKFSISAEQAIEAMIHPSVPGYLEAEAAVTEALNDVKAHEVATMTGMEAALKDLLERLGPQKLSERIDASTTFSSFLGNKKARYWEAYEKHYSEIARETEESFQASFGKAFVRAYEDQVRKL